MSYNNGSRFVTSGLLLHLDAGNTKSYPRSGATWVDIAKNGNNGTLTNSPAFNSGNGGSVSFDGIDDYGSLPTISSTIDGFSISMWINASRWALPSCPCANTSGIVDWSTGYWNYTAIYANTAGPTFVIYNQDSSPYGTSLGFGTTNLNTWYYLVATFGPSGAGVLKSYNNGTLSSQGSLSTQGGVFTVTAAPSIAAYNRHCGNCYLEAKIAQLSFYNRAIVASEVLQNYNATKGRFGIK